MPNLSQDKLADTEAWCGRFKTAQGFGHQAVEFAERNNDKETAAFYLAGKRLSRAPAGNGLETRADATAALKLSQILSVKATSALALAQAGDVTAAKAAAAELDKAYPLSTAVLVVLHCGIYHNVVDELGLGRTADSSAPLEMNKSIVGNQVVVEENPTSMQIMKAHWLSAKC